MSTKTPKHDPVVFTSKIGTNKGVPRSRVWIEGKRLVDAGFTVGQYFAKSWDAGNAKPGAARLTLTLLKDDDVLSTDPCKVSGKGEKPIIDITGQAIVKQFGQHGERVEVTYTKGKIVIRGAEC